MADPILAKYLPVYPAKKGEVQKLTTNPMAYWAKELPGRGGAFNSPNLNLYAYSHQNPVKYIDPDGKSIKWAIGRAAMLMTARGRAATWRDIKEYGKFVAQSSKNLYHNVSTLWTGGLTSQATNYALGNIDRVKHAASRLTKAGILPNWSNATRARFTEIASKILKNPIKTFNHSLGPKGNSAPVKGFYGKVGDNPVVIFVYKTDEKAGRIATSYIPSAQQMKNWKLK